MGASGVTMGREGCDTENEWDLERLIDADLGIDDDDDGGGGGIVLVEAGRVVGDSGESLPKSFLLFLVFIFFNHSIYVCVYIYENIF